MNRAERRQHLAEQRYTAWARKVSAEQQLERVVIAGMDMWADAVLAAIAGEPPPPALTAAGYSEWIGRLERATSAVNTWNTFLRHGFLPRVSVLFGEAFNQVRKTADHSSYRYEQAHIQEVHDRLVIWPEGAWDELRPNIAEALADAADLEEVKAKVAHELGIDSESRRLRADAQAIQKRLDTEPDMPGHERATLQGEKTALWNEHDQSLGDWEWKARRIARTEVQGAVEGGQFAAAEHAQATTGEKWYRRWLSTPDDRTRFTHRVADGQVVGPGEKFRVGHGELRFPGDPMHGDGSLVINCRCTVLLYSESDLQRELRGENGSLGEVRPGGVRLGPDDETAVATAIEDEKQAQREWDAENGLTASGLHYVKTQRGVERCRPPSRVRSPR